MPDEHGSSAFERSQHDRASHQNKPATDTPPSRLDAPIGAVGSPTGIAAPDREGPLSFRPSARKYHRIQIVRFLAAFVVVLFHSVGTSSKYFPGQTRLSIFGHGDLGVDLFFVISGFIIFITVDTRERTPGFFLRRRLERIVPMYWIATILMFALLHILYHSSIDAPSFSLLTQSMAYSTWITGKYPVIYPGWTLEYEMAFYLLVAAVMSVTSRTWPSVILVFSTCVALGLLVQSFPTLPRIPVFMTNPMYMEFVLGIIVGHWVLRRPLPFWPCAAAAAVLICTAVLPWTEAMWRLCVAGLPATLVVAGAAMLDRRNIPLSRFGMVLSSLGDASYSIYLVQVISISILCKALRSIAPGTPLDLAVLIAAAATLLFAYGVHLFVERPIGVFFHRRTGRPTTLVAVDPPRRDDGSGRPA